MLELQSFLFDQNPSRNQLFEYKASSTKPYRVCVYRNHSFELIEHTISAYLDYADMAVEFVYSDYDDSLSFREIPDNVDLMVLWLDMGRYHTDDIDAFINARLDHLTGFFTKPVLFVPLGWDGSVENKSVLIYDMDDIRQKYGDKMIDSRMESFTGTRLSAKAISMASRQLGLKYIPALLRTPLKAIIADLDNTLYRGVLGEDGITGIELTDGHRRLQKKIHEFAQAGLFVCIVSKNDEADVLQLFDERSDFPLKKSDISKFCVSWNEKSASVSEISQFLNIGIDSMLFVDDNYGEVHSMMSVHPDIHVILAYDDAEKTLNVLENYPGMMRTGFSYEDSLRRDDVIANEERKKLKSALTGDEYIKSLQMHLHFDINNPESAKRVSELANKTNQFIFNYKRYSLSDVEKMIHADDRVVIAISLSDKLSSSGIIGVCCAKKTPDRVVVEECFVSCRALGRGIDNVIVLGAIDLCCQKFNCRTMEIEFKKGERNLPAENFIKTNFCHTGNILVDEFSYSMPDELIEITTKEY